MKKNYFYSLFAALMLFVAMPATAQVEMTDLYGKWKFTAEIEWSDAATEAQKAQISNECDVIIAADDITGWYEAKIVGFAGSKNAQFADMFQSPSSGTYAAKVANPNPTQAALFDGMLLANANGDNPYGIFEGGEWVVKSLGTFYYILNEDKTEMKVQNDFTIVTVTSHEDKNPVVVATLRNAKMTLVEAAAPEAPVEVADISGDYIFKAAPGIYTTMENSKIPTEFAVNLVKGKSDDNKTYDATIAIEGYDNVTLPAAFDGEKLTLAFNNSYIKSDYDVIANSIRIAEFYEPAKREGSIKFTSNNNGFALSGGLALVSDSIGKNKAGDADSTYVVNRQYYADGTLKLASDVPEAPAFDWAGVYTVNSKSVTIIDKENKDEWASEFEMKIEMVKTADGEAPAITSFMDYDIKSLCGGLVITPAADGKSATVALNTWYSMAPLHNLGNGEYLVMTNAKGQNTQLTLTVNEDGTLSIENFAVAKHAYGAEEFNSIVVYKDVTAEPYVAPAFNWAGTYKLEAKNVVAKDGGNYPSEFYVTVIYNPSEAYPEYAGYYVVDFMGNDIGPMNYGGILLEVAEDGNSANLANGKVHSLGEGNYLKIYDAAVTGTPISATLGENGVVAMADFAIAAAASADAVVVEYKEVTLKKVLGAPVLVAPVAEENKDINSLMYYSFNFGEKVVVNEDVLKTMVLKKGDEDAATIDSYYDAFDNGVVNIYNQGFVSVTAPGKYTLELPAGLVTSVDGKEFIGAKYEFTVVAKAPSYSITPNGSADVNSIEKITIKCENVAEIAVDEAKQVNLTFGITDYVGVVAKVGNSLEITFTLEGEAVAKIEEEGEYVLTLPEGLFTMRGLDDSEVVYPGEEFTYNVVAPSAFAELDVDKVEVLADGSISIVYNQPVASAWDADGKTHSQTIIITNENGDELTLLQNASWTVNNTMRYISADSEYNGYDYVVAPLPAGTYTIDVSQVIVNYAGTEIFGDGWSYWEWSTTGAATGTYTFTVEAVDTAIDGVEAEVENDVIYDLTGRRVNEITKAGIYIVNGKKVLVK